MPGKASSPWYRFGLIHGAYDRARPPRLRTGFHEPYARSWMYRQGFARGFLQYSDRADALAASAVQPDPAAHSVWIEQIRALRLAGCTLDEARALAGTMPDA